MSPQLWRLLPRSPIAIALIGALIAASTLGVGLALDDVLVRARLLGVDSPWGTAWWDLYTFAREDINGALRDAGFHPWWADPSVKMYFFRPLSAATHVLDYALWPDTPALHHLHSVLWYGAAVFAACAVFRRVHPEAPEVAALAGLAFAVAAPHVSTVAWIAARNTMIAFIAGCAMLGLHARGGAARRLGAPLVLILGLLTGEAVLGGLAYVFAWQLCLERAPWRARLAALAPYLLIAAAWRGLYVAAGFGAQSSGIYHDPGSDLLGFLGAFGVNLPVLMMSRWLLVPVDGWAILPPAAHAALFGLACAALAALAALIWPLLRGDPRARFWAAGGALALAPFAATMPMDRLLLFGGLGSAGLLAMLARSAPAGLRGRAGAALLVMHLPLSAGFGLARGLTGAASVEMLRGDLRQAPTDDGVPSRTFVYVSGTFHRVHYDMLMRATGELPAPRRSAVLSSMLTGSNVTRTGPDTLEIAPDGGFMAFDLDRIHRRDATSLPVGATVSLPDLDVEILESTADGRPARARFRFRTPLEDPSLEWLVVEPGAPALLPQVQTRPFSLPEIGETVRVEGGLPAL